MCLHELFVDKTIITYPIFLLILINFFDNRLLYGRLSEKQYYTKRMYYPRFVTAHLQRMMSLSPIVVLQGARQTGKSTLVQHIAKTLPQVRYRTMDDLTTFAAARQDPQGFVASLPTPDTLVIDEIQRAQNLLLAIKAEVDKDRRAGRFLLTGSAHTMVLPRIADSLAGRMRLLTLWPLSQDELRGTPSQFLSQVFAADFPQREWREINRSELIQSIVQGGYPEMTQLTHITDRADWVNAYITAILQRDVRDIANIDSLTQFPRLLMLIATRSSALLNASDIARSLGVPAVTLRRYLTLLEATFLTVSLPAYFNNLGNRVIKTPKLFLSDTGVLLSLLGMDTQRLLNDPSRLGAPLESFVMMEILKMSAWSDIPMLRQYHFQNHDAREVDLVLERADGDIVGIEVKASASVGANDFKGLRALADMAGQRFVRGIVLYTGSIQARFDTNLWALPISALWEM